MEKQVPKIGCLLSALEKTQHEMKKELEGLKISLEKVLDSLMPKIDSLLSDITTAVSTVSASVAFAPISVEAPSSATSKAKEELKHPATSPIPRAPATSVFQAAEIGDLDTLLSHLKYGTSANLRDKKGFRLLHLAVSGGQEKTAKALLDAGAVVNVKGPSHTSALHLAVEKGIFNIVKMLLAAGADVNAKDAENVTSLMLAAKAGHLSFAKLLIEKGASLDERNSRSKTALWYAVNRGANEIVKFLCDKGASVSLGESPLVLASERGNAEAVMLMLQYMDPMSNIGIRNALSVAKDVSIVWAFVDSKFGTFIRKEAEEAMRMTTRRGPVHALKALLDAGCDVNATAFSFLRRGERDWNRSALYLAKECNNTECVKLLLERGAKE